MSMHDLWVWLATYPAIWTPILGAVISLLYTAIDKTSAGHHTLQFVAAVLPFDLPKMKEAASSFLESVAKKNASGPSMLAVFALPVAIGLAPFLVSGCALLKSEAPQIEKIGVNDAKCMADQLAINPDADIAWVAAKCAFEETPAIIALFSEQKKQSHAAREAGFQDGMRAAAAVRACK